MTAPTPRRPGGGGLGSPSVLIIAIWCFPGTGVRLRMDGSGWWVTFKKRRGAREPICAGPRGGSAMFGSIEMRRFPTPLSKA